MPTFGGTLAQRGRWMVVAPALCAAALSSCDNEPIKDTAVPSPVAGLRGDLTTSLNGASAPADGVSQVSITATVIDPSYPLLQRVIFTTTAGVFVRTGTAADTVPADDMGHAVTVVRAPGDAATAVVRAVNGQSVSQTTLQYTTAYPDSIHLALSSLSADSSSAITVTATLRRALGMPTKGATVSFVATDSVGVRHTGQFAAPTLSDASGAVTVTYWPADSVPYHGPVWIIATTARSAAAFVKDTVTLFVKTTRPIP